MALRMMTAMMILGLLATAASAAPAETVAAPDPLCCAHGSLRFKNLAREGRRANALSGLLEQHRTGDALARRPKGLAVAALWRGRS